MNQLKPVDHAAIGVNQGTIILLLLAAFILGAPWLVAVVSAVMLLGSLALRKPGFFWLYRYALKPLGVVKPAVIPDHPEPHLFAQGFGGTVLLASTLILWLGLPLLGWALAWLVIFLAGINLFGGFCLGCFVYYWLNRLGAPGFRRQSPEGTAPGFRPKAGGEHVG